MTQMTKTYLTLVNNCTYLHQMRFNSVAFHVFLLTQRAGHFSNRCYVFTWLFLCGSFGPVLRVHMDFQALFTGTVKLAKWASIELIRCSFWKYISEKVILQQYTRNCINFHSLYSSSLSFNADCASC